MIDGRIILKDGTELLIDDGVLVRDGLTFSESTSTGGRFDIGTFNAAELKLSIYDEEAAGHEFDGAVISLSETGEDGEAPVPLGTFYADGTKTDRRNKLVKLTAYDAAVLFDVEIDEEKKQADGYDVLGLIADACTAVTGSDEFFTGVPDGLPNVSVTGLSLKSGAIQTWRDAIMWAAQLVCANAVVTREGRLALRRAKYRADGETILTDHEITGDERRSIRFSDVRTYIKYLTAYETERKTVNYTSAYTSSDAQARPGEFTLAQNPLLQIKNEAENRRINESWLKYIDGFKQREIRAELLGNARIELGDACRFIGGTIDVRRSIVGVVTDLRRKYGGITTVICHAPDAAVIEKEG
ncbi:MAG: hypothetical protein NC084_12865 [Bacteroides sp.]|nr:hypothetical protein [Eubacterium sp.]MCM1419623.1 hypothetical protein [Roseburia sp.]MCM1463586.1 hypothetical protein [Bacteroides sp.]